MKKIAFILQCLTGGGAERTVANLSFVLSEYFDVYILLYDGKRVTYPHKATIIDLELPPKRGRMAKALNSLKRIKKVKSLKREYQFDYVISFMFGANIVNVLSKCNEKIVTSARNFLSAYGLNPISKFRERFIAKRSDNIVAISEMVKIDMVRNFGLPENKIHTIYNPCDVNKITNLSAVTPEYIFDSECFYFITIGRLVHQKGQWNILKAFKLVTEKYPNARLIVLGEGNLESKLKGLVNELEIQDYVVFCGFTNNPFSYLVHSDVFVLSSLHEGLGNVILEAMACGKPVISSDCYAGPREILAPHSEFDTKATNVEYEEYGVLVPEFASNEDFSISIDQSHQYLAEAMIELYNSEDLRNRYEKLSLERIKDFMPQAIASKWLSLLE